jgi:DNA-binding transcriptional LysR family regulator
MLDALTLDQLRILVTVADLGSFSAAGRQLRRVQSAISKSARTLEETLSIQVLDRTGKYPVLTPAGSALVDDARKLLRDADALKARARGMAEGLEPELALAVDPLFLGKTARGWVVKSGNDGNAVRERVRSVSNAIAFRWPVMSNAMR